MRGVPSMSDYHGEFYVRKVSMSPISQMSPVNINVQQAYWSAESTDLNVTQSLWDYMSVSLHSEHDFRASHHRLIVENLGAKGKRNGIGAV